MRVINGNLALYNGKQAVNFFRPNQIPNLRIWLRNDELNDFILNFQSQTGTVSTTATSSAVTGVGTSFAQADIGKRIRIGGVDRWISTVISATSITVDSNFLASNSAVAYSYGFVSEWIDRGPDLQNFAQTNAVAQPLIYLINGKPTVYFNINRHTDFLLVGNKNLGTKQTYFFKFNNLKTSQSSDIFNSTTANLSSGGERPRFHIDNSIVHGERVITYNGGGNSYLSLTTIREKRKRAFGFVNMGAGWNIYEEANNAVGEAYIIGSPTPNQIINSSFMLGNYLIRNSSYSFIGQIDECVVFDRELSNYERAMVLNYLNFKK